MTWITTWLANSNEVVDAEIHTRCEGISREFECSGLRGPGGEGYAVVVMIAARNEEPQVTLMEAMCGSVLV